MGTLKMAKSENRSLNLFDYVICPELKQECEMGLQDKGEFLLCGCGKSYGKIEGILDLRPVIKPEERQKDQLIDESKYYDKSFMGMFILRQFGHLANIENEIPLKFNDRNYARLIDIRGGGEIFYQTLFSLISHYLNKDLVVLDAGCGTGRIVGELGRAGVKLAIGLDYSHIMATQASKIICANEGETVSFKVRTSRSQLVNARIKGWGLKNSTFLIADAKCIPLRKQFADLITCVNLLHRVRNDPMKVIQQFERVLKKDGILLISNSYDWSETYTPRKLWFDDLNQKMDTDTWKMINEIDGLPYYTGIYNRKLSLTLNHVQVFQKIR